ncbi:MAG: hypothetical protein LBC96_05740 [Lachnospiraceae bacterium]|jgi:hypothetical protein|nr:hypothetical protein [Lachnospiraceae bacterium]
MSSNNTNGGGCLLWIINTLVDIFNNRRIEKRNKQSRGLEEYLSVPVDVLFPAESLQENIIISGGDTGVRHRFSEQLLRTGFIQDHPIILLHQGNGGIESTIARNNWGVVVNKRSLLFDAFTSFDLQEICQLVFDTCKAKYDIKPGGRYILQIVYELLACRKLRPYFAGYARFTYHQIPERINECLTKGLITQDKADNLNSLHMMGQSECAKIDTFFYDMKAQMSHIAADKPSVTSGSGISILSAIKNKKILCIELNSSANTMLVELIVNSLTIAMNRGYQFSLFLDDIAITNNDLLKNALCQKSNHNNIICTKDLYALLGGNENVFTTLCGEAEKTVLLSHGSHLSCEKWSKYIGEYDKIDVSRNTNAGWGKGSAWSYNTNQGQTTKDVREYKVKPEQINRLSADEVFVYDNQTGSLMQTRVG